MLAVKLLIFLFVVAGGKTSDSHYYYVATEENSLDCPPFSYCHTLGEYVQQQHNIFTSNTTIEFLPGLHELNKDGPILVTFVKNLTLVGSSSFLESPDGYSYSDTVVFCTNYSGFFFGFVTELTITNITFTHCGAALPVSFLLGYIALGFMETTSLELSGVTVEGSIGFGLCACNTNTMKKLVLTNCNFIRNNEYIRRNRQCIDPIEPWTCHGGNVRLFFLSFNLVPTEVEINHSTFLGGVAALNYESHGKTEMIPGASGLEIMLVLLSSSKFNVTINNTVFKDNIGPYGGNINVLVGFEVGHTQITIHNCSIEYGYTELLWPHPFLGTVHAAGLNYLVVISGKNSDGRVSQILKVSNTRFSSNFGGAMALMALQENGAVCNSSGLEFLIEDSEFTNNSALSFSAGIFASMVYRQPVLLESVFNIQVTIVNTSFNNNIEYRESLGITRFYQFPKITITNSTFINNSGSHAVDVYKSKLYFTGRILFQNNTSSTDGGALYLHENSLMYFKPDTRILFRNNTARHRGGAIYVETFIQIGIPFCFFQLDHVRQYQRSNVQLVFEGNHANQAGVAIYGGRVDSCYIYELKYTSFPRSSRVGTPSVKVFEKLFNFSNSMPSLTLVSSDPIRVCFCNSTKINYAQSQIFPKEAFPGQLFEVSAVPLGQYNGTTNGVIVARITTNTTAEFEEVQRVQRGHITCTPLQYSIVSDRDNENIMIQLTPQGVSREFYHNYTTTFINVTMKPCPPGFQLWHSRKCDCDLQLRPYNVTCDINNETITKAENVWINATYGKHSEYLHCTQQAVCNSWEIVWSTCSTSAGYTVSPFLR